jgi:DNA polymerase III delta prime subunit
MNQDEIIAKAQAMAEQHKKDILEARENLVKDMIREGYNPDDWVIVDNLQDIREGKTYEYTCWAAAKEPNKLKQIGETN